MKVVYYEDNLILDLVKACDADILVADDTDLTPLSPWNGRPILRPGDFVHQILHRRKKVMPQPVTPSSS